MHLLLCLGFSLLLLLRAAPASAYSVLTHQANIDSAWNTCLRPALLRRFPGATVEQEHQARAFAYGGAIIQDMGYYPFGAHFFTNLTHYVRTGAFVRALLDEAHDRDEYAFALGALAHYAADNNGHSLGTNRAVASIYPELAAEYGPAVTFEEAPIEHTQVEFSFDVVQVAAGRYRSEAYHGFIGFQVAKEVLERAFLRTYGLTLSEVFVNVDLAIGSNRFAVSQLLPELTRAAWHYKRAEINTNSAQARKRDVVFRYSSRQYRKEFGEKYERPGVFARLLSGIFRVLPKIGPLQPFAFHVPTPEATKLFQASFAQTRVRYCALLGEQTTGGSPPPLPNTNFDTGRPTAPGEYAHTDETYTELLGKLEKQEFKELTPDLRANL
ncbi:MAG: zinc dependent phospholipase C family protein, partial [Hymenobacteraceae bacterium]|nr:zinc dependent phospholipase C family protein [Hymenobacteraceae bacterium]